MTDTAPSARRGFLAGLARLRRGPWELVATVLIGLGVVMLMQPVSATAYAYSFVTILAGTGMFAVVSHFPE